MAFRASLLMLARQAQKEVVETKWKLLRGDKVAIISGKDKGEVGIIKEVLRDKDRVIIEGKNLMKKHVKKQGDQPGYVVQIEAPIHRSNVAIVDPETGAAVRTGVAYLEDGTKVRVTKGKLASGCIVPRPAVLTERRGRPLPTTLGPKDTGREEVLSKTWQGNNSDWPMYPFAGGFSEVRGY